MTSITCVIPTHGRPDFLREALVSVSAQQNTRAERVIVVDDLGTPATRSIVEEFAHDNPEMRVDYERRASGALGASASRNFGAEKASSDLIAFLDDDDLWDPNHLDLAVETLMKSGADLSISWMNVLESGVLRPHFSPLEGLGFVDVLGRNPGVTGSNIVVSRRAFDLSGGFDPSLPVSNDKDFLASCLKVGLHYAVVTERTVTHRRHASGQLTTWNAARAAGLEVYLDKYEDFLTRSDRRFLKRQIHSIRARAYRGFPRLLQVALLLVRSSPSLLLDRARTRIRRLLHSLSPRSSKGRTRE